MNCAQREDISVVAEHLAEKEAGKDRHDRQNCVWEMRQREQGGGRQYGFPAAKQSFQSNIKERLQDELLNEGPNCVLQRSAQRQYMSG